MRPRLNQGSNDHGCSQFHQQKEWLLTNDLLGSAHDPYCGSPGCLCRRHGAIIGGICARVLRGDRHRRRNRLLGRWAVTARPRRAWLTVSCHWYSRARLSRAGALRVDRRSPDRPRPAGSWDYERLDVRSERRHGHPLARGPPPLLAAGRTQTGGSASFSQLAHLGRSAIS